MSLTTQKKEKIFKEFGKDAKDSGSVYSQVALFTKKISDLTEHLKSNRKDYGTQRSLQLMVGKRKNELGGSIYYELFNELGANVPKPDLEEVKNEILNRQIHSFCILWYEIQIP